jgi:hypothetical protein
MLWQENVPKTDVEQTKGNGRSYPYLYLIGDLTQQNIHKSFHSCTDQGSFLRNFLSNNELGVN